MDTITVFCILAFVLSIDYSLGLISLQAYWLNTGGENDLSGLVFGLYDGPTIFVTPFLAWLIDNKNVSYKATFVICVIINIIGNVIYAVAYAANSWEMIMVGRFIGGIGASCIPLQMCYVADRIERSQQQKAVGYIKYVAALSRSVGPILASIFSACVDDNNIINLYTLVGWVPVFMGILSLVFIYKWLEDPVLKESEWIGTGTSLNTMLKYFWPVWVIGGVSTFIYWFYMGNAFIIGTHYYHIVNNEQSLGLLYCAGLAGYLVAFCMFFFFREQISNMKGLFVSTCLMATVYLYLAPENAMYHVAVGMTTFAYGLMIPSINGLNNVMAKNLKTILKGYFNITIISLTIFQGLARFIGPSLFTFTIIQNDGPSCDVDSETYNTHDCSLKYYETVSLVFNTVSCAFMLIGYYIFSKKLMASESTQSSALLTNVINNAEDNNTQNC